MCVFCGIEEQPVEPLTEQLIQAIHKRNPDNGDIQRLLAEIDRISGLLADCWIRLDDTAEGAASIAHSIATNFPDSALVGLAEDIGDKAVKLLMEQQAPGWKGSKS